MTERKTRDAVWARLIHAAGHGALMWFLGVPVVFQLTDTLWTYGPEGMTWHFPGLIPITKFLGLLVAALLWGSLYSFWQHHYRMTWQDYLNSFKIKVKT